MPVASSVAKPAYCMKKLCELRLALTEFPYSLSKVEGFVLSRRSAPFSTDLEMCKELLY